jgi:site-specific recombinase XerD
MLWICGQHLLDLGGAHMSSPKRTLRIITLPKQDSRFSLLSLLLQEFLLDRQVANASAGTLRFYQQKLEPFLDYLTSHGITAPDELTAGHLRCFMLSLQQAGHTPGGQHAFFRAIRAFLYWLEREGELSANPIRRLRPPRVPEQLLDPVSLDDVRAMLGACDRQSELGCRDRAVILALLDTGARASEMIALNMEDVDLRTGTVLVRCGKGRKPRATFLGARSQRVMIRYLRYRRTAMAGDPLWSTNEGKRLSYSGLRDILRRRARAAGVPAPTLHAFRRGFAILSLRNGADVYSLQRLLGHSSLQVLRRYLKQTRADLHEAHRRTGPVDNLL